MNNKKRIITFICLIYILLSSLLGCKQTPSASEVALGYYNLLIKQDSSNVISLGMSPQTAHIVISNLHTTLRNQIENQLSMNQLITLTDEQITTIENAYLSTLHQLNATAHSKRIGLNAYNVTLSSPSINFDEINQNAANKALKQVSILDYPNETTYLSNLTETYISYLIEGYTHAIPASHSSEASFIFTKQHGLWLPKNQEDFVSRVCNLVNFQ
ncbi:MAG: hypothetical protein U0L26_13930 [Cellulosilyticum sp.]|nr:hypothetical protein [Cellulosilyticum sp.]MEE1073456.1 hypothetical protein [Cellulosilyticum sp.]